MLISRGTEYRASIYSTGYGDLFLNNLKRLELDFPLSLALNLFSMIPGLDVQFPGYASFNSTRGMWEGGGVPSASQVRWLFGRKYTYLYFLFGSK